MSENGPDGDHGQYASFCVFYTSTSGFIRKFYFVFCRWNYMEMLF